MVGPRAGKQPLTLHPMRVVQVLGEVLAFLAPMLELNRPFLPLASSACAESHSGSARTGDTGVFRTLVHAPAALVATQWPDDPGPRGLRLLTLRTDELRASGAEVVHSSVAPASPRYRCLGQMARRARECDSPGSVC